MTALDEKLRKAKAWRVWNRQREREAQTQADAAPLTDEQFRDVSEYLGKLQEAKA